MNKDLAAFLEHHGVKGQRWGIRNKNSSTRGSGKKKFIRNIVISATASAAVGAVIGHMIAKSGTVPVSQLRLKEQEMARVQRAIQKAMWQNPVHKNAAESVKEFVARL